MTNKKITLISKVFVNKRTGQPSVVLPKKVFKNIPKEVSFSIDSKYFKDLKW